MERLKWNQNNWTHFSNEYYSKSIIIIILKLTDLHYSQKLHPTTSIKYRKVKLIKKSFLKNEFIIDI